jgi:Temperature dependent protein affecting M2 dsRNA replication
VARVTRYFQSLLNQHSVPFIVAPYSSAAQVRLHIAYTASFTDNRQLAYLERPVFNGKQEISQFIDAIIGPTDLFLFNVEKVITSLSTRQGTGSFDALSRSACQGRLDKAPDDVFRDVQLLLGSQFLPTFPLLDKSGGPKISARDALGMLNSAGRSVIQLCHQWRDDPQVQALDYEDKYKRAILSLRHHVVLDKEGKAILTGSEYDAGDAHEFIGLRLPEELYFYISRAMIGPRVPNWLTSGEIDLTLPVGCEDTEAYRHLLGSQLTSLQTQTICLLSNSMNRFYQSRSIRIKTWYSRETHKSINVKEEPSVKARIAGWKVHEAIFDDHMQAASVRTSSFWWMALLTRTADQPNHIHTLCRSFE